MWQYSIPHGPKKTSQTRLKPLHSHTPSFLVQINILVDDLPHLGSHNLVYSNLVEHSSYPS